MPAGSIPDDEIAQLEATLFENLEEVSDELKDTSGKLNEQVETIKAEKKADANIANSGKKKPWLNGIEKKRFLNIAKIFTNENILSIGKFVKETYDKSKMLIQNVSQKIHQTWDKSKSLYNKVKNSWWTKLILLVGGLVLFWDKIKEAAENIWEGLDPALKANLQDLTSQIVAIFGRVGEGIMERVDMLFGKGGLIAALNDFIRGDVTPMLRSIFNLFRKDVGGDDDDFVKREREAWKERANQAGLNERYVKNESLKNAYTSVSVASGDYSETHLAKNDFSSLAPKMNANMEEIVAFAEKYPEYAKAIKDVIQNPKFSELSIKDNAKIRELLENTTEYNLKNLEDSDTWKVLSKLLSEYRGLRYSAAVDADGKMLGSRLMVEPLAKELQGIHENYVSGALAAEKEAKQAAEARTRLQEKAMKDVSEYGAVIANFNKLDEMVSNWKAGIIDIGIKVEANTIVEELKKSLSGVKDWITQDMNVIKEAFKMELEKQTSFNEKIVNAASELSSAMDNNYNVVLSSTNKWQSEAGKLIKATRKEIKDFFSGISAVQEMGFERVKNTLADWIKNLSLNLEVDAENNVVKVTTEKGDQITNNQNIVNQGKLEDIKATISINKADMGSLEDSIRSMNKLQEQQVDELSKQNRALTNILEKMGLFNQSAVSLQQAVAQQSKTTGARPNNFIIGNLQGNATHPSYTAKVLKDAQFTTAQAFNPA